MNGFINIIELMVIKLKNQPASLMEINFSRDLGYELQAGRVIDAICASMKGEKLARGLFSCVTGFFPGWPCDAASWPRKFLARTPQV
jgi:hypothetical protein